MNRNHQLSLSSFPILVTERLVLRELSLSDAADLLVFRGDPYVQRYNGPVYETLAEAQRSIQDSRTEYMERDGITWGVTLESHDHVIGHFGFHSWSHHHRRAEVGYDLARAYWGQGIAAEALQAIVRFGFEQMRLNHIYAGTIADNHESVRLLERVGFHLDGIRRKFSWEDDGTFHDSALYSLLQEDYVG